MERTVLDLIRAEMGGKSGAAFAKEIGLTQSHFSKILRGEMGIGRKTAARLAKKYPSWRDALYAELLEVA